MSVESVTKYLAIGVPVVAALILGYLLYLGKKSNWELLKKNKLFSVLVPLLLVVISVANIAVNMFNNVIS